MEHGRGGARPFPRTAPPRRRSPSIFSKSLYPTRPALADALRRLMDADIPLDGASDHDVSEALYLRDTRGEPEIEHRCQFRIGEVSCRTVGTDRSAVRLPA